jgi:hypothetical protein
MLAERYRFKFRLASHHNKSIGAKWKQTNFMGITDLFPGLS